MALSQIKHQVQQSCDLQVDIQCFSEVNRDVTQGPIRKQFLEDTKQIAINSRSTWSSSQVPVATDYKPGGTGIVNFDRTASRVKRQGTDDMGRWAYTLLDGKGDKDVLIMSIYQVCKDPTNPSGITAYHQQEMMLGEKDRQDKNPRRNFFRDLRDFLNEILVNSEETIVLILLGDWNEECVG